MTCGNCDSALTQREWRAGHTDPYCPRCHAFWADPKVLALVRVHRRIPPSSVVSLVYEPNGTDHHDVILRVATWAHRSDSYYYVLDHPVGQEPDPVAAIRALLVGWQAAVEACADGEVAWLAHHFSDRYSGWLRCLRRGDAFEIVDGWAGLEGWAFYPSDFAKVVGRLDDFTPHHDFGEPVRVARQQLLADIQASVSTLDDGAQ
ncbi:MAG: hypothetical protein H6738_15440 [Alphaproteobacteria bacterium]|nr:hypothetical protein [Alphaproteobacteria bacterium]MCB9698172.1 hypothetical protein [Alphaproteobacteria bacterium]